MENKIEIKSGRESFPQIYAYTLPTMEEKDGWIKIGYTTRKDVDVRIREQLETPAKLNIGYTKLWFGKAQFIKSNLTFTDKEFHSYLKRFKSVKNKERSEWFYYNGTPEKSKMDYDDFINEKYEQKAEDFEYILRDEQNDAVEKTLAYFNQNKNGEFLWNAKPRFGKTLTAYDLALKMDADKVLIVTNRPAIANSWFDDYQRFIAWQTNYKFVSTSDSLKERPVLTREEFLKQNDKDPKMIAFISLQDLKGAISFGGCYDKLTWVKDLEWNLLIIDEAHEGIDTFKSDVAFNRIKRENTLHLSGTPFKAIATGKFSDDQIFNWTYADEQEAKENWDTSKEEENPYEKLPRLNLFSYQISNMLTDEINKGANIEGKQIDYAFDLNEFFETNENGKFVHESDILKWLDTLIRNEKYPFSTSKLREELKHTFWILNRVSSAKALERLLKENAVFENYEIIIAAGDGKALTNEEENDGNLIEEKLVINEKSFERVKEAIKNKEKTITLSVGQLTTGITIPEWTAVLMLSNMSSPSLYMQAAFRAQNPWQYEINGNIYQKKNAYIFDFAPERTLRIYDEFANNLSKKTTAGSGTSEDREKNIKQLINFFPVIAEDEEGKMIELDVNQVLTIPKTLKAKEVVRHGFMSNLLFQQISRIFASAEAREIIEQLNPYEAGNFSSKNTTTKIDTKNISVNDEGNVEINENVVVKETKARFGEKIYIDISQSVDENIDQNSGTLSSSISNDFKDTIQTATIEFAKENGLSENIAVRIVEENSRIIQREVERVSEDAEINKAEAKLEYEKQIKDAGNDVATIEKATENFEHIKLALNEEYKSKLKEILETKSTELAKKTTETILRKAEEKKKNIVEDDIRDRLRGFARTIPSFLMAYGDENTTLSNFTDIMNDEVFKETTGISIKQFVELRDTYNFFDEIVFNESVQEFMRKRTELANYFDDSQEECIFDYIPPQRTNQIFTPKKVVKMMVDNLEKEYPDDFKNPDKTFADLYVKSGLYLAEIVKRLFVGLKDIIPDKEERLKHILENQIYGFAPSEVIYNIARNYIFGFDDKAKVIRDKHIICLDTISFAKGESLDVFNKKCANKFEEEYKKMKFDAIVGNPPYQENIENRGEQPPIYDVFYDNAMKLSSVVTLITPARFLFDAGKTPSEWNQKMLNDEHFKVIEYFQNSREVFRNVDIKGGVAVTLHDTTKNFGAIEVFIPNNTVRTILNKVKNYNQKFLSEILYSNTSYKYSGSFFEENPTFKDRVSGGSARYLSSSVFEKFPEVFYEVAPNDIDYVKIIGRKNNQRETNYFAKKYLVPPINFENYKVYLASSNGSGVLGEALSLPIIGEPYVGATETFVSFGNFKDEIEAQHLVKYIKCKFLRLMLGTKKVTQGNKTEKVWSNVPLQDFTNSSDIDWSKQIHEIDQQLYKKYNLTKDEIDFIEENVKEM